MCVSHCKISRLTLLAFVISPQIAGCGAKTDKFSKSIGGAWISKRYGLGDQKINTQHWKIFFSKWLNLRKSQKVFKFSKNVSNHYLEFSTFRIEVRLAIWQIYLIKFCIPPLETWKTDIAKYARNFMSSRFDWRMFVGLKYGHRIMLKVS